MACSPAVEKKLTGILNQPANVGANKIFKEAMDVLHAENIPYVVKDVTPQHFFVHRKNRAGLGLSWHNAHRNGARIQAIGADKTQLVNAVAVEMGTGEWKAKHVDFNVKLISKSKGLLAEPSGYERYVSLGCGHTVGFCKAAKATCKTSQRAIDDGHGHINLQLLYKDPQYKDMIDNGWDWVIIPQWVDERFPKLADVAQRALNASSNVASLVGEIEAGKAIADHMQDNADNENWKTDAVAAIVAMGAPCSSYAEFITTFVEQYAGGQEAPLIDFLDSVSKQFQCNVMLGETFWKAVVGTHTQAQGAKFPLVRNGLILANLTSPKIEDGIARLLVKNDVTKLFTKSKIQETLESEKLLHNAMTIVKSLRESGRIDADVDKGPLGRLFVRVILKLVDKELQGTEGVEYTMNGIRKQFLDELSDIVGGKVTFSNWEVSDMEPEKKRQKQSEPSQKKTVSLEEHASLLWRAQDAGFRVNAIIFEKAMGNSAEHVYRITTLNDSFAVLEPACDYDGVGYKTVKVELEALMDEWHLYKSPPPFKLDVGELRHASTRTDQVKAAVYLAMLKADAEHGASSGDVAFFRCPDQVRTTKAFKKKRINACACSPSAKYSYQGDCPWLEFRDA